MKDVPYFMKNENWYYYDAKLRKYVLTEKAPRKAIKSYEEFYEEDFMEGDD